MVRSEEERRAAKAEYNRWYRRTHSPPSRAKEVQHEYQRRYRDKVRGTPEYKARVSEQNRRTRERYGQTPEYKARKQAWQTEHPENERASGLRYRLARRAEMIAAYGGRCACCGESEPIFLTLDHVDGSGAEDRRTFRTSHNAGRLVALRKAGWPQDGYRLLCWNCQYGTYRGTCPHQLAAMSPA